MNLQHNWKKMSSDIHQRHHQTFFLLIVYIICGALHELAHLSVASWLIPSSSSSVSSVADSTLGTLLRAVLGRYSLIELTVSEYHDLSNDAAVEEEERARWIITHAGWIFSLSLAISCHLLHAMIARRRAVSLEKNASLWLMDIFQQPAVPIVAYITALESIVTDLFGFVPIHPYLVQQNSSHHKYLICFCGNFGVLLLNPSWLSIDGGRQALDILEKMVNVTMMRGKLRIYVWILLYYIS